MLHTKLHRATVKYLTSPGMDSVYSRCMETTKRVRVRPAFTRPALGIVSGCEKEFAAAAPQMGPNPHIVSVKRGNLGIVVFRMKSGIEWHVSRALRVRRVETY